MMSLSQNPFTISPKGHPFKTSNFNTYHSSKRLMLSCQSSKSGDHLKFASSSFQPERSVLINDGKGVAASGGISNNAIALPPEVEFATRELRVPMGGGDSNLLVQGPEGIGIVKYLKGKTIFVTGVTGFLAKVLIEKLLRTIPDVDKIYVLIKAKNKEAATKRLKNEVINADIFKCLEQYHGKSYENFMLNKLVPVVGNLREPNLLLDKDLEVMMAEDVDIIINSAGNTNFHERYDVAIDINTQGPTRVMAFAEKCKKLKLFLQISTAYVNGQRQGRVMEKPFRIGESIAAENDKEGSSNALHTLSIDDEIHLALSSAESNGAQEMKELGLERARKYGWQDTYVFTKAMGEMLLGSKRGDVPLVIIRPSIIESTYRDPFPGWIEGNRMMDPLLMYYGKGHLLGFLGNPDVVIDVVPVDMVVNATLAAIAKHGESGKSEINVYHVASSVKNPVSYQDMVNGFYQHFSKIPCLDSKGNTIPVKPFEIYNNADDFSSHEMGNVMKKGDSSTPTASTNVSNNEDLSRKIEKITKKLVEQARNLASLYEPYVFYGGRFDNTNTDSMIKSMSEEEKRIFHFDVGYIDWEDYIVNVHIPGLRRHVVKERGLQFSKIKTSM